MSDETNTVLTGGHLLVVFNGEILALTLDEWREARERGRVLMPSTTTPSAGTDDRIVDAAEAAKLTGVPASWFETQMREGRLPHLMFGRYRRLRWSDVIAACETGRRPNADSGLRLAKR